MTLERPRGGPDLFRRFAEAAKPGADGGGKPSASSRAVPMLMTVLGMGIVVVTQAAQRGMVVGFEISPMAYVFGGILVVLGVLGVGRRREEAPPKTKAETGPIRESGRDPNEAEDLESLRETLRHVREQQERQRDHGHR